MFKELALYRHFLKPLRYLITELMTHPALDSVALNADAVGYFTFGKNSSKGITGTAVRENGYVILTLRFNPLKLMGLV